MSTDRKVLLSAIIGSAVAVLAIVVTLVGDVRADLRDLRADLRSMDERLRNVEISFGKVDQRLLTIERVVLPGPDADE